VFAVGAFRAAAPTVDVGLVPILDVIRAGRGRRRAGSIDAILASCTDMSAPAAIVAISFVGERIDTPIVTAVAARAVRAGQAALAIGAFRTSAAATVDVGFLAVPVMIGAGRWWILADAPIADLMCQTLVPAAAAIVRIGLVVDALPMAEPGIRRGTAVGAGGFRG